MLCKNAIYDTSSQDANQTCGHVVKWSVISDWYRSQCGVIHIWTRTWLWLIMSPAGINVAPQLLLLLLLSSLSSLSLLLLLLQSVCVISEFQHIRHQVNTIFYAFDVHYNDDDNDTMKGRGGQFQTIWHIDDEELSHINISRAGRRNSTVWLMIPTCLLRSHRLINRK